MTAQADLLHPATGGRARGAARRVATLALLAEVGTGYFAASVVALHRLRPDLDPATRYVSEYARGRRRAVMAAAFGGLGMGVLALTVALAQGREFVPRGHLGLALLGCGGTSVLVDGVFPTDDSTPGTPATTAGRIHGVAALVAFGTLIAAMFELSLRLRGDARWRILHRPGLALATEALGWLVWLLGPAQRTGRWGRPQRALIATIVLWLLLMSHRLRAIATAGSMAGDRPTCAP